MFGLTPRCTFNGVDMVLWPLWPVTHTPRKLHCSPLFSFLLLFFVFLLHLFYVFYDFALLFLMFNFCSAPTKEPSFLSWFSCLPCGRWRCVAAVANELWLGREWVLPNNMPLIWAAESCSNVFASALDVQLTRIFNISTVLCSWVVHICQCHVNPKCSHDHTHRQFHSSESSILSKNNDRHSHLRSGWSAKRL